MNRSDFLKSLVGMGLSLAVDLPEELDENVTIGYAVLVKLPLSPSSPQVERLADGWCMVNMGNRYGEDARTFLNKINSTRALRPQDLERFHIPKYR